MHGKYFPQTRPSVDFIVKSFSSLYFNRILKHLGLEIIISISKLHWTLVKLKKNTETATSDKENETGHFNAHTTVAMIISCSLNLKTCKTGISAEP